MPGTVPGWTRWARHASPYVAPLPRRLPRAGGEILRRDRVEEAAELGGIEVGERGWPISWRLASSSPSNSIADSSITRSAAKIGASERTAIAIASDGRESISISEPFCCTVMLA
jgi:hypothetical protein